MPLVYKEEALWNIKYCIRVSQVGCLAKHHQLTKLGDI